jgi:glutaredoxin
VRDVVLYSRPRCGLCDAARETILGVRREVPFEFREVNVETDDALELDYGTRIPVVTIDGDERFEIEVDPSALSALVHV